MLEIKEIEAGYGHVQVLFGLSASVAPGEILCLMGRNGAGKTTTLKTLMGLVRADAGEITFKGQRIDRMEARQIPKLGIGYVPQGRRLFADLTVRENLEIGRMTRNKSAGVIDAVLELFPRLADRLKQRAGTLSGGEQQMLATARALCLEPDVLLLDEPSEGLQPSIVALIGETVRALKDTGTAIILVEQRVETVLSLADRVVFVENGATADVADIGALNANSPEFGQYVGIT